MKETIRELVWRRGIDANATLSQEVSLFFTFHVEPLWHTAFMRRYRVTVDPAKNKGYDSDARRMEALLNGAADLYWEVESRNHSRGTKYLFRTIDSLIEFATAELGLDVISEE